MTSHRDEKSGKPIGNGKWKVVEDDFGPNTVNFGTQKFQQLKHDENVNKTTVRRQ